MVTVETFKTLQTCEKKTVHKADTFRIELELLVWLVLIRVCWKFAPKFSYHRYVKRKVSQLTAKLKMLSNVSFAKTRESFRSTQQFTGRE